MPCALILTLSQKATVYTQLIEVGEPENPQNPLT